MILPIPTGPGALTPEWLGQVLERDVGEVTAERIGEDQSFSGGGLYRLRIGADETLIAKLSPADEAMRAAFATANRREVEFYLRLGRGLPVPKCAHGAFDAATGASALLLQDLRDHSAGAFVAGWSLNEAEAVVRALAAIHARRWDAPEAAALQGAGLIREFDFAAAWTAYPAALAALLPDVVLPSDFLALGDFAAASPEIVFGPLLDDGPVTLLHRDCHADNVMFAADGSAVLLDWQTVGRGRGAWDLCYALVCSIAPGLRRSAERALVETYLQGLRAGGITGYGWRSCWRDYRRAFAARMFVTVVATVLMDNSGPAKAAFRRVDLERLLAFFSDHSIGPELYLS